MSESIKDAMQMTNAEFAAALKQIGYDAAKRRRERASADYLKEIGAAQSDDTLPDIKPGTETGTTVSTQRAPSPSADTMSGDALSMTSAEWQAALRNLR